MPFVPHCLVSSIVAPKYSSSWRLAISTSPVFVISTTGPGMLSIIRHDSRNLISSAGDSSGASISDRLGERRRQPAPALPKRGADNDRVRSHNLNQLTAGGVESEARGQLIWRPA